MNQLLNLLKRRQAGEHKCAWRVEDDGHAVRRLMRLERFVYEGLGDGVSTTRFMNSCRQASKRDDDESPQTQHVWHIQVLDLTQSIQLS